MAYLNEGGLQKVYSRLKTIFVQKSSIVNSLAATSEGKVLDARQGKALKALVDAKAAVAPVTATLSHSGWSQSGDVYTQTVNVSGVTASGPVIVSPQPAAFLAYSEAQVYASAQSAGKLTFTAVFRPDADLAVNCLVVA